MKDLQSYIAPVVGLCVLGLADYSFISINLARSGFESWEITLVVVYNFLVFMSVWSLMSAMCKDPGYIPYNYTYAQSKLSSAAKVLYDVASVSKDMERQQI